MLLTTGGGAGWGVIRVEIVARAGGAVGAVGGGVDGGLLLLLLIFGLGLGVGGGDGAGWRG